MSDVITNLAREGIKWGVIAFGIYEFADVLKAYAGQSTYADVSFSWLVSDKLAAVLGLLFGTGGILYGRKQARLKEDVVERMHQYQVQYEQMEDSSRTSSGLTKRGNTRKEDI